MRPDVVVAGNLIVDDLVFADGRTRMAQAGGATVYAALGARLWGARTGCVSLAGADYPQPMLQVLERLGVDLSGVHRLPGCGVRAWLLYEDAGRQLIHRAGCPAHDEASPTPEHFPREWRSARAVHLAPMPFASQLAILKALDGPSRPFVSIDPHQPVTTEMLPAWREALAYADAFFPGEDELLLEEASTNPRAVLPRLCAGRLRFVVFTRGARGGLLFDAQTDTFHEWTPRTAGVVDPTGAGDAFATGFVTGHLDGLGVAACLRRAVVTASFALEAWGPDALLDASRTEASARLQEWYRHEALL